MAQVSEHGIRLSSMSPSFLNSNSTSHTWPFSAVAELIDNASDPGVSAKQIWIDVVQEDGHLCLTFTDNGSGMTPNKLHKMLSFGFTEKGSGKASLQAIGVYGNGFKSGSMRLGRDALIFTKNGGCQSVGLLSQTYLENIKAQAVVVPIVPFNQQTKSLVVTEDSEASLRAILQNSIIKSQEQIHAHFDSIPFKKGTKILIWNIRRAKDGKTEIDFDTDHTDLRLPEIQIEQLKKCLKNNGLKSQQNIPDMHYSLRAYISILYLKPRTQVILRGKKILAKLVANRLSHVEHDVYKPQFSKEKVKVTFGLNPIRDHYGIMMYHKNRLIKAFEKVGCQLKTSGQRTGIGVVGVIECNFLKPAHNKQDFEYTKEYRLTLGALGVKLNDYWKVVMEKKGREREIQAVDKDNKDQQVSERGPVWLQCEECLKWRSVRAGHYKVTPENWTCSQNPNPRYRSCSSPEEVEKNDGLLTPSYQKNHKKLRQPNKSKINEKLPKLLEEAEKQPTLSTSPQTSHIPALATSVIRTRTVEPDETSAHSLTSHHTNTNQDGNADPTTQLKPNLVKRDSVIKEKNEVIQAQALVGNGKKPEDTNHGVRDVAVGPDEKDRKPTEILRLKRKSDSVYQCLGKKKCLPGDQLGSTTSMKDAHPKKQMKILNRDHVENADTSQQTLISRSETHSVQATQTVAFSPLTKIEGLPSWAPPPVSEDRKANLLLLASLETEVQRIRSLLGLKTSSGGDAGKNKEKVTPEPRAGKEIGCQTDTAGCSTDTAPAAGPLGIQIHSQRTLCDSKDQPEQNVSKLEKTDGQSRTMLTNSEACDNRSVQQNLKDVRNNVVVLLTALLPQLDLTDISLETDDVDNILQQIIEVNSLKL